MVESYIALITMQKLTPQDVSNIEKVGALVPYISGIDNHYIYIPVDGKEDKLINTVNKISQCFGQRLKVTAADVEKQLNKIKKSNMFNIGDIVQCPTQYALIPFTVSKTGEESTEVKLRLRSSEKNVTIENRFLAPAEDYRMFSNMLYKKHGRYLLIDCDALTLPNSDKYTLAYNFIMFLIRIKTFYYDYDLLISNPDRIFYLVSEVLGLDMLFGDFRTFLLEETNSAIYTRDPRMIAYSTKVIYTSDTRMFDEYTGSIRYTVGQLIAAIRHVNRGNNAEEMFKEIELLPDAEDYPLKEYHILAGKEPDVDKVIELFCSTCTQDLSSNVEYIVELLH